jgi:integrase
MDVTRADVVRFHASWPRSPFLANRIVGVLREVFGFGERTGVVPANPARAIAQYKEPPRKRFLSEAEMTRLGQALAEVEQEGAEAPHAVAAIRLLLFTGCRRGEILHARWRDVNGERSVLHLRDAKAGPRDVPLSAPALEVLESLPRHGEWIVPWGVDCPAARRSHADSPRPRVAPCAQPRGPRRRAHSRPPSRVPVDGGLVWRRPLHR